MAGPGRGLAGGLCGRGRSAGGAGVAEGWGVCVGVWCVRARTLRLLPHRGRAVGGGRGPGGSEECGVWAR